MPLNTLCERLSSVKFQILATIVANVCTLGFGTGVGWTSPSLPLLQSTDCPLLSGPVSIETAAWIGAMLPLGSLNGTFLFGLLSNYIGSKRSVLLCALPLIIHWFLIIYGDSEYILLVARYLCGVAGGGLFICIPLYVAEIASDRCRGLLSSWLQLTFYTGIVFGYIGGAYLPYRTFPLVMMTPPLIFIGLFVWMPRSPQWLLKHNDHEEVERSLRFYRNIRVDDGSNNAEDEQKLQQELQKLMLIAKQNAELPSVRIHDFLTLKALRGLLICSTLLAVAQFSGTFTLSNYASTVFAETGSNIDPNVSSIFFGCIQVLGTICASSFIDRLGRKALLLISTAGSATALLTTGAYAYLNSLGHDLRAVSWLPIVSLSFFIFIAAAGLSPVPYVLLSEVLPPRIRRIGATICVCTVSVYAFVMLRVFPGMLAQLGLSGCMWFFGCVSVAGFVFVWFVVEETKGMNLDQLQQTRGEE